MSYFTSVWGTTYTLKDIWVTLFKEKTIKNVRKSMKIGKTLATLIQMKLQ